MTERKQSIKNYEILSKEARQFMRLIREESDRGRVLLACGMFDVQLKKLLLAYFQAGTVATELLDDANGPLGTLSARISLAYALGLISEDEYHNLTLIRRIRNDFAHDLDVSFGSQSVLSRCANLRLKTETNARGHDRFLSGVISVAYDLMQRPKHVSKGRPSFEPWPEFDSSIMADD
jgi:mannitol operon repressor